MAEDWNAIAAEVEGALKEVGNWPVTLRYVTKVEGGDPYDPDSGTATPHYVTLYAVQGYEQVRDQSGTLVGQTKRTLTVDATSGTVPGKGMSVALGVTAGDANAASAWIEISAVRPLAPAGTAVLYELDIAL
ncbi:hypothetical protein [Pararhizobium mangrovi]|uniref:Uncharacterized protein n=1 Tax=Pararhizobium mangrovi TaxID=2590452 RepID=A0A506TWZ1_9HYPH|nr:hypothetical protein [Pararhizobium mangrovi]TPW26030.1 hypothetical protein FJU11_16585 [Pararhizobium mangrovi]